MRLIRKAVNRVFLLGAAAVLVACGPGENSGSDNSTLNQAMAAGRYLVSDRFISRSGFSGRGGSAEDFVNYLFSDMGAAEWPIAFDEFEAQQLRSAGIPVLPQGVSMNPNTTDPNSTLQLVFRADPATNKVIVEAYESAAGVPVSNFERSF